MLVRAAVARHLGTAGVRGPESRVPSPSVVPSPFAVPRVSAVPHPSAVQVQSHASHAVYVTLVNSGEPCVIEPDVPCNHCNYCKSHGH
jgi:threonine dehydrogenase-like Zn-dependent dehydrogenase